MTEPGYRQDITGTLSAEYVAALERDVLLLREQVYKWKTLARKWQDRSKANKADLDVLRAEIAKSARKAALLAGSSLNIEP